MGEKTQVSNDPPLRPEITGVDLFNLESFDNSLKQGISQKIQDPIVMQTKWLPVDRAGEFYPRELVEVAAGRLEFRVATVAKANYLFMILFGIGAAICVSGFRLTKGEFFQWKTAVILLFCAILSAGGVYLYIWRTKLIVFDIGRGVFWKGKSSYEAVDWSDLKYFCRLEDIHALQVIPVFHMRSSGSGAYYSYELNLVLKNGQRISVINHGDRDKLVRDTATIATFIGKPVWDVIDCSIEFYKSVNC